VKRNSVIVTFAICLAMAVPILAAVILVQQQAYHREQQLVLRMAHSAIDHSDDAGDQLVAGARVINSIPNSSACSDQALDLMRAIDLESTLLQAVAHRDAEYIDCSSLGGRYRLPIGKPDFISANGYPVWIKAKLWDGGHRYLMVGHGSFIAIFNRDLPLSYVESYPGAVVATFNWSNRVPILERGKLPAGLLNRKVEEETTFRQGKYAVAIVRSKRYDMGSIVAVPLSATARLGMPAALILIPIALLAGIATSLFVLHLLRTRTSMPAMIGQGLKAGEFYVVYQPVVELRTGNMIGAEALLRWRRSNGDMIPPDVFIAAAERTGSICKITTRLFELITPDMHDIMRNGTDFHLAVNVSADDLLGPGIVETVERFSADSGLPLTSLIIEITERSLVDVPRVRKAIAALRHRGARVAIDDFGTGYSSLGYLAELELDMLKIDKLFVHALGTDSATSQVAMRIVEMASDLDLQIVAEGIEKEGQADWLRRAGVEFGQGYFFSEALSAAELVKYLRSEAESRYALHI